MDNNLAKLSSNLQDIVLDDNLDIGVSMPTRAYLLEHVWDCPPPTTYKARSGRKVCVEHGGAESVWSVDTDGPAPEHIGPCSQCMDPDKSDEMLLAADIQCMSISEQRPCDESSRRGLSPVAACNLPADWSHRWTFEERQHLLTLRFFSIAVWGDIARAQNRQFGFNLSERAVRSQFDHICLCLPMQIVADVQSRDVTDPVVWQALQSSGFEPFEWGQHISPYDLNLLPGRQPQTRG